MRGIASLFAIGIAALAIFPSAASAGIYSTALANVNAGAPDAGIAGFVGPDGDGLCLTNGSNNYVNPIFKGWATGYVNYDPFDLTSIQNYNSGAFAHPEKTLGAVTGDNFDIASLGDMTADQIAAWQTDSVNNEGPGSVTLTFAESISNRSGADFAVFENSFISAGGAGVAGQVFAELAYVEVSTDGVHFARFPSISQTAALVDGYGTIDPTNVYNLAGKHVNAYGNSWGTPFNLDDLTTNALVLDGTVNLSKINYVRLVDIPGNGSFTDSLGNPIYDAWRTYGSGGLDLDAVGAINYYGKTLASTWDNTNDADTRAFIDTDTTLSDAVTVGALQFNGSYRLDGESVTLGANNRGINVSDPNYTAVLASDLLGSNGLTKSGGGTLVFDGAKSYTGDTIVEAGTLKGTVSALSRDIADNATVELVVETADSFTNTISGTGSVTLSGGGVLTLQTAQTYTGTTKVQAGTLRFGIDDTLADTSVVHVAAGANLDLNGHSDTIGGLTGAGQVMLENATLTLGACGGRFDGAIGGKGNVVIATDAAIQTFGSANSFQGSVTLQSGSLAIDSDAALGNASNAVQFNGGMLQINGIDMHDSGHLLLVGDGCELKINVVELANTFNIDANLTGNAALGIYGSGTVVLSGTNDHTGGTTLSAGTLQVSSRSQLGAGTLNFNGGTLKITGMSFQSLSLPVSGSTFKLDIADAANTYTVGSEFNGSGTLYKYGDGSMVVSSAATRTGKYYVYGGSLAIETTAGIGGNSYLYGDGKLTLQNTVVNKKNIYVREQSELRLEGSSSSTGKIYLYDNGVLVLGDNATLGGTLTISGGALTGNGLVTAAAGFCAGSTLAPGQSVGTLEFKNVAITMQTGSILEYEFNALGGDLISGIGGSDTLTLGTGGILELISLDGTDSRDTWLTLFEGFETINGSMDDWTVYYNGQALAAKYMVQDGRLAVMVPEPSTFALLAAALYGLIIYAWRKRQ